MANNTEDKNEILQENNNMLTDTNGKTEETKLDAEETSADIDVKQPSGDFSDQPEEPAADEPETEDPEIEDPEMENPEIDETGSEDPETKVPEIEETADEYPETEVSETEESDKEASETETFETEEPEIDASETEVSETEEPEIEASEIEEPETEQPDEEFQTEQPEAGEAETEETDGDPDSEESSAEAVEDDDVTPGTANTHELKKRGKRRSAEILGVFAKHNFYANGLTPEELRTTLEDLGPTYVKIGQIMSSRVDLLPDSYCKELELLRQNVQELDPALARMVIEQETGKKIDEIYSEFRDKPLGSASIGQVHYAVLKDGTPVVTKVQRPMIAEMMRQDFSLLKKMASVFNVVMEGAENAEEQLDLLDVIREFEKVTEEELDFRVEAANTKYFKEHCIEDETKVTCPVVFDELTTERIFTMSFVDGYSISKKDQLIKDGYDVEEIGRNIVDNYLHQVLDTGTFHADPHQGNIMVTHGIPCWIDFGMMGQITDGDVNTIQSMILAVLERDVETIANSIMSIGAASAKTNRDKLIEELDVFLDRYMTVTSLNDLDVSVLFEELCAMGEKHHIKMPGKFTMLVRSLATIEGVIERLCPELNLFEILSSKLMDRARTNFDLEQQLISTGKDVLEISKKAAKIPVLASDLLKSASRGRMKINLELTGYEELLNKGGDMVKNIVLAVFASILFIGSCLLCLADISPKAPGGVPVVAAIGLIFSVALAVYTVKNMSKKK